MKFHADFDQKLIGGATLHFINKHSQIIADRPVDNLPMALSNL
jgi:hypothetical protein